MNKRKIFIILFAILYICVCGVSMLHAVSFFGLANNQLLSVILAITFEIGQAAVLFSILTNNGGNRKIIPWILMIILTTVQIMGNVFSSYEYLIINSADNLRYIKEPIFMWSGMDDAACNVILSYIMGGILPICSLLLTAMVTNYVDPEDKAEEPVSDSKQAYEKPNITVKEEKPKSNDISISDKQENKKSHFINI